MGLNFLNKEQALSYFNKATNLNADKRTFLIYCLEHEISIKYKALNDFEAILGFSISYDEYTQLIEHRSSEVDLGEKADNTIYAQGGFEEQSRLLSYQFCKLNFPDEHNCNIPLIRMNALTKSYELIKETDDYKNLLKKKDFLNRLTKIKEASQILYLGEESGGLAFHEKDCYLVQSGIYEFFDSSLSFKGGIEAEIHAYLDNFYDNFMPRESRFFIFNNYFYYKQDQKPKHILDAYGGHEIFQQGFLKTDIDKLIEILTTNLSQESKNLISNEEVNNLKHENKRLLRLIGAMLEENKQRGLKRANQDQIALNIVEMIKNSNAELGERTIKGIFANANKEFKQYKSNT